MRHCGSAAAASALALLVLGAGCASPSASPSASVPVATNLARPGDLSGSWQGTVGWVGAYFYEAEALFDLRIKDDGTFAATVKPNRGTNNLAKASTLSGTVVNRGNRVTLRNTEGPWPWLTLVRTGNTLYGVAVEPGSQANVMLKFDRAGS